MLETLVPLIFASTGLLDVDRWLIFHKMRIHAKHINVENYNLIVVLLLGLQSVLRGCGLWSSLLLKHWNIHVRIFM